MNVVLNVLFDVKHDSMLCTMMSNSWLVTIKLSTALLITNRSSFNHRPSQNPQNISHALHALTLQLGFEDVCSVESFRPYQICLRLSSLEVCSCFGIPLTLITSDSINTLSAANVSRQPLSALLSEDNSTTLLFTRFKESTTMHN